MAQLNEYPKCTLSIFNLNREKVCDLYDSEVQSPGQAYNIEYTSDYEAWETLRFDMPYRLPDGSRNHRWDFVVNEYLVRLTERDRNVWFIIHIPKKTRSDKAISESVTCTTLLSQLRTKQIYKEYDGDETGIDTLPNLATDILNGTGWTLDTTKTDTFYEADGTTEKIRSLDMSGGVGAYKLLVTLCELFNGYLIADTDKKTVAFKCMENRNDLREMAIGRDLTALTVSYNTEDIITRLYVEGEYGDDGYVGIDEVNPTGLNFLMNFDYYKEIGLFTAEHQAIYDNYINSRISLNQQIKAATATYNTNSNKLNTYWGQYNYVEFVLQNGQIVDQFIGGEVAVDKQRLLEGDYVIVVGPNKVYRAVTVGAGGAITFNSTDKYAVKYATLSQSGTGTSAGWVGSMEASIAAKQESIKSLNRMIAATASEEKKATYRAQIAEIQTEINKIYDGWGSTTEKELGLKVIMYRAADLAYTVYKNSLSVADIQQQQIDAESTFMHSSLGDLIKDGKWNNPNYIVGQEAALYADAQKVMERMSRPVVTYSVTRTNMAQVLGRDIYDFEINTEVRVYDSILNVNALLYVKKITRYMDHPWDDKIEITDEDISLSGKDLGSVLQRISEVTSELQSRADIYNRTNIINMDGSIFTERLEGTIDVLKHQFMSSRSSWYTDDNGNMMFVEANDEAAMMLCGDGFMIANGKDENGNWNWRTFGSTFRPTNVATYWLNSVNPITQGCDVSC